MTSRRSSSSRPRSAGSGLSARQGRGGPRPRGAAASPATRATSRTAAGPPGDGSLPSRSKLTGRAAILLLVLAVLAVSYASSTRAWLRQRSDIQTLTAQIRASQAEIASLEQEKRRWQDPAYIKTKARLRFGWVMPGETGYRVIGDDGQTLSDGTSQLADPVDQPAGGGRQWWDSAWGSVVAAGGDTGSQAAAPTHTPLSRIDGPRDPSSSR